MSVSWYHGHPAEGGDALADGRQVIEELAAAIALPEALDLLDVVRDGLQQVVELRLQTPKSRHRFQEPVYHFRFKSNMCKRRKECLRVLLMLFLARVT